MLHTIVGLLESVIPEEAVLCSILEEVLSHKGTDLQLWELAMKVAFSVPEDCKCGYFSSYAQPIACGAE